MSDTRHTLSVVLGVFLHLWITLPNNLPLHIISLFQIEDAVKTKTFCPVGTLLPHVYAIVMDDNLNPQPMGAVGQVSKFLLH